MGNFNIRGDVCVFTPLTTHLPRANLAVMNEALKRGRGRPKGSSSPNIVSINVNELLEKLNKINSDEVKVSRTWLLDIDKSAVVSDTVPQMDESDKIEYKLS